MTRSVSLKNARRGSVWASMRMKIAILTKIAMLGITAAYPLIGHLEGCARDRRAISKPAWMTMNAKITCTAGSHLLLID